VRRDGSTIRSNRVVQIESFPPIADAGATRLILGSMPGVASLTAQRYYAHPQNAFWRIMGELLGFAADADYDERVMMLTRAKIAVWDVLATCERPGSLDSAIKRDSEVANNIPALLATHTQIRQILFNGGAAEATFRRHHAAVLKRADLSFVRLPSTSPAHASLSYSQKCAVWRAALME